VPGPQGFGQRQNELAEAQRRDDLREVQRIRAQNVQTAQYRYDVALEAASQPGLSPARRKFLDGLVKARNAELQAALDAEDAAQDAIDAEEKRANDERTREAKKAADDAASRYRDALDTREQNLRNAYAAALRTPGTTDDRKRFDALRDFFVAEGKDPKLTAKERAGYRGELESLKTQRKTDIEQAREAANQETRDHLTAQEQVLKNRVAAAELTEKNKADDLRALRKLRDFYKRSAKDEKDIYTELEQGRFEADRIATQKKINEVLTGKSSDTDRAATAASLLGEFNRLTKEFASNVMSGGQPGTNPATVVVNQNFKAPTTDRHREARMARIAVEASFLG
jgi:hypothetical protein